MKRKQFLSMLGAALVTVALAGCSSFAPVYGDGSSTSVAAARFNFAPPNNRLEQVIINRLRIAFPATATASDPLLTVAAASGGTASSLSDAFEASQPSGTRVEATVTITQNAQVVFTTTRFTDTSYQGDKLTLTNSQSSIGAQETAARSTAESLRAAILAGYRPGMAPLVLPQP